MRTLKALAVAATAVALTAPAAVAQQATTAILAEQQPGETLSDSYIGADVVARSPEGTESVGKVTDLLLDDSDKIVGVVVDVGGFLGVGAKPVGLSWATLEEEQSDGELLLRTSLTRQELEDAPEFKTVSEKQLEKDRMLIEQEDSTTLPQPTQ